MKSERSWSWNTVRRICTPISKRRTDTDVQQRFQKNTICTASITAGAYIQKKSVMHRLHCEIRQTEQTMIEREEFTYGTVMGRTFHKGDGSACLSV